MKKHKILIVIYLMIQSVAFGQTPKIRFSITNNSILERKEVVLAIDWSRILIKNPIIDTSNFKVIDISTKKEVPFQFEFDGKNDIQNLLVQVSVKAKSEILLAIENGKPTPIQTKTYARFVPERLDDFAWENDKIAFRTYGKALEGTKGDAFGFDVWVKRTDKLVINERYKGGKYHFDNGDGLDYYHVGHTLGAGNIAPIVGDSIIYPKNYHRWKILDNGPLRTSFILEYDEWSVNNLKMTMTKKISLDAGSQMNKIVVNFQFEGKKTLPIVVGIIKRPEQGMIFLDEKEGISAYWEPQHGEDGITGVGVFLPEPVTKTSITDEQILTHSVAQNNKSFVYFMGAAWNKAHIIMDGQAWFDYLKNYKQSINEPLKVTFN